VSSELLDSGARRNDIRSALKGIHTCHREFEDFLDGVFNELPTMIEGIAARQRALESASAADCQQETDRHRQRIAEMADQQAMLERQRAVQAAELQAAREQTAALADQLADQRSQTQRWQEMAEQKLAELGALVENQHTALEEHWHANREQAAAGLAAHREDTASLTQTLADLKALVEDQQSRHSALSQAAGEQAAAIAQQLAELKAQTGKRTDTADVKQQLAELHALLEHQRAQTQAASEQVAAMTQQLAELSAQAGNRTDTADFKQQLAELHALLERQQASQQAQTQAAAEQATAMTAQLAELRRQGENQEDSSRLQQALAEFLKLQIHQDRKAPPLPASCEPGPELPPELPEGGSEQERQAAQRQAQWNELLRSRSRTQKP
jgi:hypothetical protein